LALTKTDSFVAVWKPKKYFDLGTDIGPEFRPPILHGLQTFPFIMAIQAIQRQKVNQKADRPAQTLLPYLVLWPANST
jgi:hypothetical protein